MRQLRALLVLLLLLGLGFAWWNADWQYRKAITITNNDAVDYTDIQIKIIVDTATLIAEGKMNEDCSDLRFVDSDDAINLAYWIESGCNTSNTIVWVKIPSLPTSGTAKVYMYYGNPSAASESDGDAVFLFFDDFDGDSLDTSKWVVATAGDVYYTISNGYLQTYNDDSASDGFIIGPNESITDVGNNTGWKFVFEYSIELLGPITTSPSNVEMFLLYARSNPFDYVPENTEINPTARIDSYQFHDSDSSYNYGIRIQYKNTSDDSIIWDGSSWGSSSTFINYGSLFNGRYVVEFNGSQFRFTIYKSDGSIFTQTTWANLSDVKGYGSETWWFLLGDRYNNYYWGNLRLYDFRIRKYISTDPSISVGGEEEVNGPHLLWHTQYNYSSAYDYTYGTCSDGTYIYAVGQTYDEGDGDTTGTSAIIIKMNKATGEVVDKIIYEPVDGIVDNDYEYMKDCIVVEDYLYVLGYSNGFTSGHYGRHIAKIDLTTFTKVAEYNSEYTSSSEDYWYDIEYDGQYFYVAGFALGLGDGRVVVAQKLDSSFNAVATFQLDADETYGCRAGSSSTFNGYDESTSIRVYGDYVYIAGDYSCLGDWDGDGSENDYDFRFFAIKLSKNNLSEVSHQVFDIVQMSGTGYNYELVRGFDVDESGIYIPVLYKTETSDVYKTKLYHFDLSLNEIKSTTITNPDGSYDYIGYSVSYYSGFLFLSTVINDGSYNHAYLEIFDTDLNKLYSLPLDLGSYASYPRIYGVNDVLSSENIYYISGYDYAPGNFECSTWAVDVSSIMASFTLSLSNDYNATNEYLDPENDINTVDANFVATFTKVNTTLVYYRFFNGDTNETYKEVSGVDADSDYVVVDFNEPGDYNVCIYAKAVNDSNTTYEDTSCNTVYINLAPQSLTFDKNWYVQFKNVELSGSATVWDDENSFTFDLNIINLSDNTYTSISDSGSSFSFSFTPTSFATYKLDLQACDSYNVCKSKVAYLYVLSVDVNNAIRSMFLPEDSNSTIADLNFLLKVSTTLPSSINLDIYENGSLYDTTVLQSTTTYTVSKPLSAGVYILTYQFSETEDTPSSFSQTFYIFVQDAAKFYTIYVLHEGPTAELVSGYDLSLQMFTDLDNDGILDYYTEKSTSTGVFYFSKSEIEQMPSGLYRILISDANSEVSYYLPTTLLVNIDPESEYTTVLKAFILNKSDYYTRQQFTVTDGTNYIKDARVQLLRRLKVSLPAQSETIDFSVLAAATDTNSKFSISIYPLESGDINVLTLTSSTGFDCNVEISDIANTVKGSISSASPSWSPSFSYEARTPFYIQFDCNADVLEITEDRETLENLLSSLTYTGDIESADANKYIRNLSIQLDYTPAEYEATHLMRSDISDISGICYLYMDVFILYGLKAWAEGYPTVSGHAIANTSAPITIYLGDTSSSTTTIVDNITVNIQEDDRFTIVVETEGLSAYDNSWSDFNYWQVTVIDSNAQLYQIRVVLRTSNWTYEVATPDTNTVSNQLTLKITKAELEAHGYYAGGETLEITVYAEYLDGSEQKEAMLALFSYIFADTETPQAFEYMREAFNPVYFNQINATPDTIKKAGYFTYLVVVVILMMTIGRLSYLVAFFSLIPTTILFYKWHLIGGLFSGIITLSLVAAILVMMFRMAGIRGGFE